MNKLAPLVILAFCAGCAGERSAAPTGSPPAVKPSTSFFKTTPFQVTELNSAVRYLEKGDPASARKLLAAVCESAPLAGVTDEALFRMALLSIKPSTENTQAHQLLRRLKKEYPTSPWSFQAQPLMEQLTAADELRRQNKNFRAAKEALSRENGELRDTVEQLNRNIDKLKHLDLELEQKSR